MFCWDGFQALCKVCDFIRFSLLPRFLITLVRRQLLETERLEANDLRSKGYADRQLKELGFSDMVLHSPSVSTMTSK